MKGFKLGRIGIFVGVIIAIAVLIVWISPKANSQRPNPLPQDPAIQVYFNHNLAKDADYTDPYRNIKRAGDNLEQIILDTLDKAESTIDLAVQELRLPLIAQALVKKQQAGVKVRIILENLYNQPIATGSTAAGTDDNERTRDRREDYLAFVDLNQDGQLSLEEMQQRDAITILRNSQIPVIDDTEDGSKGTGLMHHKFLVVDGKTVIVTSANFTLSDQHGDYTRPDTRGNANNLLILQSPELAQYFTEEFNFMWGDGADGQKDSRFGINKPFRPTKTVTIGQTQVSVKFSPDSRKVDWSDTSNGLIAQTLSQAHQSVNLALFVLSEQGLADALQAQHQNGVAVKALIDPEFAYRPYSEGLDLLGVELTQNCRAELNNRPWSNPVQTVGIPNLPKGDKLHHKVGIIDNHLVIAGSHNWSDAANRLNDETVLILDNPVITAHYQREFDQLYQQATLGIPDFVQAAIAKEKQTCGARSINSAQPSSPVLSPSASSNPLINMNTASKDELESLPGVGSKLADRIIAARQEKPFTSLADLKRVSGIGDSKLQKLTGKVTW
ncbi:MAG: DUF655 domain-containing protein [Snowella sp.]|nr:DUF655 domain-containing protein [Snowella sp.]